MGGTFKKIAKKKKARILVLGIDGAGKTSFLYYLKDGEGFTGTTEPTLGFNIETIKYGRIKFNIWDVGGQVKIRNLWHHYYEDQNTNAIIYIIDSNDIDRIQESCDVLFQLLEEEQLAGIKLLVLANKQDLPNSVPVEEISDRLDLGGRYPNLVWNIQGCVGISGEGIVDSMDWLAGVL
eukprot:TRINITY_DN3327_c0_g1_i3.p1 TRINITY_DN3327_c0_g1~~TRINITY_DN3327_c0_g1_i3.p1  ORF type:complete len:179 (-),score=34.82 TRINITY_DN3327_c0_g1_i3:57-593(-)